MNDLTDDIEAYEGFRRELETNHLGKWAVVYGKNLIGTYDSFELAASDAVKKFGRGPYLIRQVGAASITLPASVMFHPINANPQLRF